MGLHKDNIYSFDENSILHTCVVKIPSAYMQIFGKAQLKHKNCDMIHQVLAALNQQNIKPHRFIPSDNLDMHLLSTANELIEATQINPAFLGKTFRVEIMDQLKEFTESLTNLADIPKPNQFQHIKEFFKRNEQQLKKAKIGRYTNIPEDDDCQILAGLIGIQASGKKLLISHDEHLWGYSDPISKEYGISIVEEWACRIIL